MPQSSASYATQAQSSSARRISASGLKPAATTCRADGRRTGARTYGAYHDKQDPGGSSSGSGVAADLGLAAAALGTETDGSIVFPAHMNNIVGIKPTMGLTSRHMVIPLLEHQDTVGPMARTVRDAAAVLQAIVGVDHRDNYTSAIPFDVAPDYVAACREDGLRGARIGVPWNAMSYEIFGPVPSAQIAAFTESLDILRRAGATVVAANFSTTNEEWSGPVMKARRTLVPADMFTDIPAYLAQLVHNPFGIRDVKDVIEHTRNHPLEEYPKRDTGDWTVPLSKA